MYDRQTDTIERVSVADNGTQGNSRSWNASISADGRYVAFGSFASNLVPGDTNQDQSDDDVFVYDRQMHTIERVSLAADGTQANGYVRLSLDQRRRPLRGILSTASNLVPGDTNVQQDVFVYDRQTDTIQRVSLAADGTQGNGVSRFTLDQRRRSLCGIPLCSPATSSPAIPTASATSSSPRTPSHRSWEPRGRVGRWPRCFRNRLRQRLTRHQVLCGQRCLAGSHL